MCSARCDISLRPVRDGAAVTIRVMRQELGHCWSLADLASLTHLSRSRFCQIFQEAHGTSCLAWLTIQRVREMTKL